MKYILYFVLFFCIIVAFCVFAILDINHLYTDADIAYGFSQKAEYATEYIETLVASRIPINKNIIDSIDDEVLHLEMLLVQLQEPHLLWYSWQYKSADIYTIASDFYILANVLRDVLQTTADNLSEASLGAVSEAPSTLFSDSLLFFSRELSELADKVHGFEHESEGILYRNAVAYLSVLFCGLVGFLVAFLISRSHSMKRYRHSIQLAQSKLPSWNVPVAVSADSIERLFQRLITLVQSQGERLDQIGKKLNTSFDHYGNGIITAASQGDVHVQYLEHYSTDLSFYFERFYEQSNDILTSLHVLQDLSHSIQGLTLDINQCSTFSEELLTWLIHTMPNFAAAMKTMTEKIVLLKQNVISQRTLRKNLAIYASNVKKGMISVDDFVLRINNLADVLLVLAVNSETTKNESASSIRDSEIERVGRSLRELSDLIHEKNVENNGYIDHICSTVSDLQQSSEEEQLVVKNLESLNEEQFAMIAAANNLKTGATMQQASMTTIKNTIEHGILRMNESIEAIRLNEVELKSSASEIRRIITALQEGSVQLIQNFASINADFHNLQHNSESMLGNSAPYDTVRKDSYTYS